MSIPFDVAPMLPAQHNFERLAIKFEGIAPGARMSKGRNNGDKTWSVDPDDVEDLVYLPGEPDFAPHTIQVRIIGSDDDVATTITVMDVEVGPGLPPPYFPRHESWDEVDEYDEPPLPAPGAGGGSVDIETILAYAEPRITTLVYRAIEQSNEETEARIVVATEHLQAEIARRTEEIRQALIAQGGGDPAALNIDALAASVHDRLTAGLAAMINESKAELKREADGALAQLHRFAEGGQQGDAGDGGKSGGLRLSDLKWQFDQLRDELFESLEQRLAAGAAATAAGAPRKRDEPAPAGPSVDASGIAAEVEQRLSRGLADRLAALRSELSEAADKRIAESRRATEAAVAEIRSQVAGSRDKDEKSAGLRLADVKWQMDALKAELLETLDDRIKRADGAGKSGDDRQAPDMSAVAREIDGRLAAVRAEFEARLADAQAASHAGDDVEGLLAASRSEIEASLVRRLDEVLRGRIAQAHGELEGALGGKLDRKGAEIDARIARLLDERLGQMREEFNGYASRQSTGLEARVAELSKLAEGNLASVRENALAGIQGELRDLVRQKMSEEVTGWQRQLEDRSREIEKSVEEQAKLRVAEVRKIWDREKMDLIAEACEEAIGRAVDQKPKWLKGLEKSLSSRGGDWQADLDQRLEEVGRDWSSKAAEWVDRIKEANAAEIERRFKELGAHHAVASASRGAPTPPPPRKGRGLAQRNARGTKKKLVSRFGSPFGSVRRFVGMGLGAGCAAAVAMVVLGIQPPALDKAEPYMDAVTAKIDEFRSQLNKEGGPGQIQVGRAVVKAFSANVRADPSANAPVVATLTRGEEVELLDRIGNWIRLRAGADDSTTGWMHSSLLSVAPPR